MTSADQLRDFILHPIDPCPDEWEATPGKKGAITGDLNRALCAPTLATMIQTNSWRHMVLAYLFAPGRTAMSSHELTREQWYCLYQWIGYWHDPVEGWLKRPDFFTEAGIILAQAIKADQLKMEQLLEVKE